MFKARAMPGGYRTMARYRVPRTPVELHSGILVNQSNKNTSDACTVYLEKGFMRTTAYVYVRDHGNLMASGMASCFAFPWKTKRMYTVLKAFENAGIEFLRSDGSPIERKESDVVPLLVKDICRMLRLSDDEFVVVRRY